MTVQELIELLRSQPQDAQVVIYVDGIEEYAVGVWSELVPGGREVLISSEYEEDIQDD